MLFHDLHAARATAIRNETGDSFPPTAGPGALGAILETFVFAELEKSPPLLDASWQLYHWRMKGRDVDIVAEAPGGRLALFEIKATATVGGGPIRASVAVRAHISTRPRWGRERTICFWGGTLDTGHFHCLVLAHRRKLSEEIYFQPDEGPLAGQAASSSSAVSPPSATRLQNFSSTSGLSLPSRPDLPNFVRGHRLFDELQSVILFC
ncbi:MAG: DUF4143 domain-containing protein [Rhodospirillales bacterium]|nr:DUF4143 domain-containing protein [Rhodospirillales bacterium]